MAENATEEVWVEGDGFGETGGSLGRAVVLGHFVEEVGFDTDDDDVKVGGLHGRLVVVLTRSGHVEAIPPHQYASAESLLGFQGRRSEIEPWTARISEHCGLWRSQYLPNCMRQCRR